MIDDTGAVVCATCRSPIRTETIAASDIFTTRRPAPDATARIHREWCSSGRVEGAERDADGVWHCTASAWRAARRRQAKAPPVLRAVASTDDDVLAGIVGMRSTRRAG